MADLTKIEKPFGLLDRETQERLRVCDHLQVYAGRATGWKDVLDRSLLWEQRTYRQRPEPRAFWLWEFPKGTLSGTRYGTRKSCESAWRDCDGRAVRFVEDME